MRTKGFHSLDEMQKPFLPQKNMFPQMLSMNLLPMRIASLKFFLSYYLKETIQGNP